MRRISDVRNWKNALEHAMRTRAWFLRYYEMPRESLFTKIRRFSRIRYVEPYSFKSVFISHIYRYIRERLISKRDIISYTIFILNDKIRNETATFIVQFCGIWMRIFKSAIFLSEKPRFLSFNYNLLTASAIERAHIGCHTRTMNKRRRRREHVKCLTHIRISVVSRDRN